VELLAKGTMNQPALQNIIVLFNSGRIEAAATSCLEFLVQHPDHARALLLMSAIHHRRANREASLGCLWRAAQAFDADTKGVLDVVAAMQRIGAVDEAGEVLERMSDNQPEVASLLAQNEWRRGNYPAALERFRLALQRWPQMAESHLACARAALRLGYRDEALRVVNEGLERFAGNDQLHRLKIAVLLDQQDVSSSLLHARELPVSSPEMSFLSNALRSALTNAAFQPPALAKDARMDALVSSCQWVLAQAGKPTWFGTATGLLEWAAHNAAAHGLIVECGVFHGMSINLLAGWTGREIHGFDSFEGLPEGWNADEPAGSYSTEGVLPVTAGQVILHPGWFNETLPLFAADLQLPISLLHVDCDLYSSTRTVLQCLGPHLQHGSLLVFDDFLAYPGYEQHEFKAAQEFFQTSSLGFSLQATVLLGRAVAFRVEQDSRSP
jgi:tetratricopeptide (TPR) repeat protein